MKIEKGMTLEQLVDNMSLNGLGTEPETIDFIFNYNNRLKEPLTKEMFVNPYKKPKKETYLVDGEFKEKYYLEDLETWQEAENMLIFKDFELWESQSEYCNTLRSEWNKAIFYYDNGLGIIIPTSTENKTINLTTHYTIKTLGDLFRATNGELELKNFEI